MCYLYLSTSQLLHDSFTWTVLSESGSGPDSLLFSGSQHYSSPHQPLHGTRSPFGFHVSPSLDDPTSLAILPKHLFFLTFECGSSSRFITTLPSHFSIFSHSGALLLTFGFNCRHSAPNLYLHPKFLCYASDPCTHLLPSPHRCLQSTTTPTSLKLPTSQPWPPAMFMLLWTNLRKLTQISVQMALRKICPVPSIWLSVFPSWNLSQLVTVSWCDY